MVNPIWAIAVALATETTAPPVSVPPSARTPAPAQVVVAAPAPAQPSRPDDRPITHVFQNLGHDLKALPSWMTGGLLLIGAGGAAVAHPLDAGVDRWVKRQPSSGLAAFGNLSGDAWVQGGAALTTWIAGEVADHPELAHIGSDLIRAQILDGVLETPVKILVNRVRPNGGHYSFPSGHTSSTFATAAVLQEHFGWKAAAPSYALAGLVGWARVRSDQHWLSDVVFGAALGSIAGKTVTAGHRQRSWAIVPARIKAGVAVYVVRVPRASVERAGGDRLAQAR